MALVVTAIIVGLVFVVRWVPSGVRSHQLVLQAPQAGAGQHAAIEPDLSTTTSVAPKAAYPGARSGDVVANSSGLATLAGLAVTASDWTITTTDLGQDALCTAVDLRNESSAEMDYGWSDWALQSPTGDVHQASADPTGTSDLGTGALIAGGSTNGQVCFADPGQTGLYVASYQSETDPAVRAVWLINGH